MRVVHDDSRFTPSVILATAASRSSDSSNVRFGEEGSAAPAKRSEVMVYLLGGYGKKAHVERTDNGWSRLLDACRERVGA